MHACEWVIPRGHLEIVARAIGNLHETIPLEDLGVRSTSSIVQTWIAFFLDENTDHGCLYILELELVQGSFLQQDEVIHSAVSSGECYGTTYETWYEYPNISQFFLSVGLLCLFHSQCHGEDTNARRRCLSKRWSMSTDELQVSNVPVLPHRWIVVCWSNRAMISGNIRDRLSVMFRSRETRTSVPMLWICSTGLHRSVCGESFSIGGKDSHAGLRCSFLCIRVTPCWCMR